MRVALAVFDMSGCFHRARRINLGALIERVGCTDRGLRAPCRAGRAARLFALLTGILVVAAVILWYHSEFSDATVSLAASALLVDALGIAGSVYKLTLSNQPKKALAPVTQRAKPG
jgi:hypothetical protein